MRGESWEFTVQPSNNHWFSKYDGLWIANLWWVGEYDLEYTLGVQASDEIPIGYYTEYMLLLNPSGEISAQPRATHQSFPSMRHDQFWQKGVERARSCIYTYRLMVYGEVYDRTKEYLEM